jgi:transcriptional regulator with XRE-family HTH domain
MNKLPFGQNLLLWRCSCGLTQAELARRARLPQPNLSDIERGAREVSLRTLRALAVALDIRPGLLADGIPPPAGKEPARLGRSALERIAAAAAGRPAALRRGEQEVAQLLKPLVRQRIRALRSHGAMGRGGVRTAHLSWVALRARYPDAVIDSLIQRVTERAAGP